jgi:pimeloyl-ACP methyl ester carboxylesterase
MMRNWKRAVLIGTVVLLLLLAVAEVWGRRSYFNSTLTRISPCPDANILALRDGRKLAYRVTGDPAGVPVLFFHASTGSRFDWPSNEDAVTAAGVRVYSVDRPGYGCSDPLAGRTLNDWVQDIEQFTSALRLRQFRVIGWSAGVPHALAVARAFPGRIISADLVASPTEEGVSNPRLRVAIALARRTPGLFHWMTKAFRARMLKDPQAFERGAADDLPPIERAEVLRWADGAMKTHTEGARYSASGLLEDFRIVGRPWNIDYSRIEALVRFWHGTDDSITSIQKVRQLAPKLPAAEVKEFPGEGHFLIFRHEADILAADTGHDGIRSVAR